MERLVNTIYEFTAATGVKAICGLCILRDDERMVAVLTELPDNTGMSVTNAAEEIATQVRRSFGLDPEQTRWIEHYPERQYQVHQRTLTEPATYDEIVFTWENYQATEPNWLRLSKEDGEIMLE